MLFSVFKFPTLKVFLNCPYYLPISASFSDTVCTYKKCIISLAVTVVHGFFISNYIVAKGSGFKMAKNYAKLLSSK